MHRCKYCDSFDLSIAESLYNKEYYVTCNFCFARGPVARNKAWASRLWNNGFSDKQRRKNDRDTDPYYKRMEKKNAKQTPHTTLSKSQNASHLLGRSILNPPQHS